MSIADFEYPMLPPLDATHPATAISVIAEGEKSEHCVTHAPAARRGPRHGTDRRDTGLVSCV